MKFPGNLKKIIVNSYSEQALFVLIYIVRSVEIQT